MKAIQLGSSNESIEQSKNDILHARLGHLGETYSRNISGRFDSMNRDPSKVYFCESCVRAKITRYPSRNARLELRANLERVL